ncbi:hypothetical protein HZB03_03225 [Candidatus Woesearchaeota archaeon]|nr:hypothetical protein [Candidatus Woesearchaeota archaeon]
MNKVVLFVLAMLAFGSQPVAAADTQPVSSVLAVDPSPAVAEMPASPPVKAEQKAEPVVSAPSGKELEFGYTSGIIGVSASPISGVGMQASNSFDIRYVGVVSKLLPDVKFTIGGSQRKYDVNMDGVSLGNVNSTTISGTLRYIFPMPRKYLAPYLGAGLYNASFSEAPLMDGLLRLSSASVSGVVVEAGVKFKVNTKGHTVGLKTSHYLGSTGSNRLETSSGNALLTNVSIKNRDEVGVLFSVPL